MMIEAAATAPKTRRRGFAMMTGDPRYVCAIIDEKHDIGRYFSIRVSCQQELS